MTSANNIWMIGDIQGCYHSLKALIEHPEIDRNSQFWFAGDLINRGPDSLQTLRYIMAMGEQVVSVLGNHDLHLLAISAGVRKPGKSDTTAQLLASPEADAMLDWLRYRPLAHYEHGHLMVHAGVLPQWTAAKTLALAAEVQERLRASDWRDNLQAMYGSEPSQWEDSLTGDDRQRIIINALTRLRMCDAHGRMNFKHKLGPSTVDPKSSLMPWYEVPGRRTRDETTVVFGHWSTLGLMIRPDIISLDTGCVWGRKLTAVRLSDKKVVQVNCSQYCKPKTKLT